MRGIDVRAWLLGLAAAGLASAALAQPSVGGAPVMTGTTNGVGHPGSGCSVTSGVFTCSGGGGGTIPATSGILAGSGTAGTAQAATTAQSSAQTTLATGSSTARTLAARAADVFNALDYGALGTNSTATLSALCPSVATASFQGAPSALAACNSAYSWATTNGFGLTFTMTTSAAQSSAGSSMTFTENFYSQGNIIPIWEDPNNGNMLMTTGLQVSSNNTCLPASSALTVSAIPTITYTVGPTVSATWATNTGYALNAEVTNGGNTYTAVTAGTSATSGAGPTGTGSSITDGSVVWAWTQTITVPQPTGVVTLSGSTVSACPAGTVVTFTISPSQLAALTQDWLGLQSAEAAAYNKSVSGGTVLIPAGQYNVNHSLMTPGSSGDTSYNNTNITIEGEGTQSTVISVGSDLGKDICAFGEQNREIGGVVFRNFRLVGLGLPSPTNGGGIGYGLFPALMDGICMGGDRIYDMSISGFHAGINTVGNHQIVAGTVSFNNGYDFYVGPYSTTGGNEFLSNDDFTGATVAGMAISDTSGIDSSRLDHLHVGFAPFSLLKENKKPSTSNSTSVIITNSNISDFAVESSGGIAFYDPGVYGEISSNVITNSGPVPIIGNTNYKFPGQTTPAMIWTGGFDYNTMIGTKWNVYGEVNQTVIYASYSVTFNQWINDPNFASQSTASIPPFIAGAQPGNNIFESPSYSGFFGSIWNATISQAGLPIAFTNGGHQAVAGYYDTYAGSFAGYALAPGNNYNIIAVAQQGTNVPVVKLNASEQFGEGEFVFPTQGGTTGSITAAGSVGVNTGTTCNSGNSTCNIQLNSVNGGTQASANYGATATGTSSSGGYSITTQITQFSTVPSGTAAILNLSIPYGVAETLINDGSNTLAVCPSSGATINGSASCVSLASKAIGTFIKTGSASWN